MGAKITSGGAEKVYAAAKQWVDCALRTDGSLFTPGKEIWTCELLGELHTRFLDRPDEGDRNFFEKLKEQLAESPEEVYQLMGEVLYVYYLILARAGNKQQQIEQVLGWSPTPVKIPEHLVDGLESDFISLGTGLVHMPFQVGTLIESVEQWKGLKSVEREYILQDPWEFKEFLFTRRFNSQLLVNNQNTGRIQREILLHIVFPDSFEAIGTDAKRKIANDTRFAGFVTEEINDVDRKILQIRWGLEAKLGRDFNFQDPDIIQWQPGNDKEIVPPLPPGLWDALIDWAKRFYEWEQFDAAEREYKLEAGQNMAAVKKAFLAMTPDWNVQLQRVLRDSNSTNLVHWHATDNFLKWGQPQKEEALRRIWGMDSPTSLEERVRHFLEIGPIEVGGRTTSFAPLTSLISLLLMADGAAQHPIYGYSTLKRAYQLTGNTSDANDSQDVWERYEQMLGFYDKFIKESALRGLRVRDRLEAQALTWCVTHYKPLEHWPQEVREKFITYQQGEIVSPPPPPPPQPPDLEGLAARVYLPVDFLEEIQTLLKDKKQVIFQGPPGTGKTYVAQALAKHLAGLEDRVTLVQFHPSYAYEDFVQGFRPAILKGGQPGFELRDGPLLQIAKRADTDKDNDYYLIIDEINRGSVAKVFGELYFLLEYRGERIRLQYQRDDEDDFLLPSNLYIIGTMNTADRSIALVDLALRRRFYFVEFHPDEEPVKDVLRRWLKGKGLDHMAWVADVVDRANEKLKDDRHAAIGPSYFMKPSLDDEAVRRIWKHSVLPYIEERRFGGEQATDEFELDKLRRASASGSAGADNGEGNGPHPLPLGEGT